MGEARMGAAELAEIARAKVPMAGTLALEVEPVLPGDVTVRMPYRDEFILRGPWIGVIVRVMLHRSKTRSREQARKAS